MNSDGPPEISLDAYRSRLLALHTALSRSLGAQTVDNIFERALFEITPAYRRFDGAERKDGRLALDSIGSQLATESDENVRAAFSALYAAVLVLLTRMVGEDVAVRLADSPEARAVVDGRLIGEG